MVRLLPLLILTLCGCGSSAQRTAVENYHRIVEAQYAFHNDHDAFPGGYAATDAVGLSWRVAVLPYLGEAELFKRFKLDEPWDSENNKPLVDAMPAVFASPGNPAPAGHTFVRGTRGAMLYRYTDDRGKEIALPKEAKPGAVLRGRTLGARHPLGTHNNISDGTANTIFFAEGAESVPWTKPDELEVPFYNTALRKPDQVLPKFGGAFKDGFHVVLVDGTVLFLKTGFPEEVLAAMLTPAGGEMGGELPREFLGRSSGIGKERYDKMNAPLLKRW
jgi:Protein of unknown function (DUF1559)